MKLTSPQLQIYFTKALELSFLTLASTEEDCSTVLHPRVTSALLTTLLGTVHCLKMFFFLLTVVVIASLRLALCVKSLSEQQPALVEAILLSV